MKHHYLMVDEHNHNKGHHITVNADGSGLVITYNQAINYSRARIKPEARQCVPGHDGWVDFYEDEVVRNKGNHGYQKYINEAYHQWLRNDKVLEAGDAYDWMINQGLRCCEVLATIGNEALIEYEMPNGRLYLNIVDKYSRRFIRNVSHNNLPKKWAALI